MSTAEILQSPQKLSSQQLRKIKKPIIEKRRRERINESLNQLKTLVLEALNKDESQYNKMEKADILEMTVKHLKGLQSRLSKGLPTAQPSLVNRYKTGYQECAEEVTRYLNSVPNVHPQVKDHLGDHLSNCSRKFEQCSSNTNIDIAKKESMYDLNASPLTTKVVENNNNNTLQGQLINGIQVGVPVNMNGSQSMMLATGPISPINATQGFVPVIISPNNNLSVMSPVHHHHQQQQQQQHHHQQSQNQQQLQTSPLPGSVIPLYSHASLPNSCRSRSPSRSDSPTTSSTTTNIHNEKLTQNIYSQQQHSTMSNCRSPPMLSSYNSPSSPSMAEDAPKNCHFFSHPEESYIPSSSQKALDFTNGKINQPRDIMYNCNSVIVSPSNYNNTTKLQHSWSDYARDLHKYGREQLVQSPNGSDVWRPW